MKPLLTRIDEQLSVCTDPLQRAELLAERACYLARIGRFAEANEIATSLRRTFGDGLNARVSVWVMLIEGLVLFYAHLDIKSRDRLWRAHAISVACKFGDLLLLTASWLAHIDFNRSDFTAVIGSLQKCVGRSLDLPSAWQVRVCLILADCFLYSRQFEVAKRWYEKARTSAVSLGDEATLGAIIYNRAALGLVNLRFEALVNSVSSEAIRFMSLELDSASSYQRGARHDSLTQLLAACRARILMLQKDYGAAASMLKAIIGRADLTLNLDSDRHLLLVELAECLHECGLTTEAREIFLSIRPEGFSVMTVDDQYMFLALYGKLAETMRLPGEAVKYLRLAESAKTAYATSVSELCLGLEMLALEINI
jgi:hypothetical protein